MLCKYSQKDFLCNFLKINIPTLIQRKQNNFIDKTSATKIISKNVQELILKISNYMKFIIKFSIFTHTQKNLNKQYFQECIYLIILKRRKEKKGEHSNFHN